MDMAALLVSVKADAHLSDLNPLAQGLAHSHQWSPHADSAVPYAAVCV